MLVMLGNALGWKISYWQGLYGNLGHLHSPGKSWKDYPHLNYALDNGRFPAWSSGKQWDEKAFIKHCDHIFQTDKKPRWLLVPDIVADRKGTLREWDKWESKLRYYGVPLAFAVQDGMILRDIPQTAEVVFIGGSSEWKDTNIEKFCAEFPRVHVGRVGSLNRLWHSYKSGAESCDSTGWFKGYKADLEGLEFFLSETSQKQNYCHACEWRKNYKMKSAAAKSRNLSEKISNHQLNLF